MIVPATVRAMTLDSEWIGALGIVLWIGAIVAGVWLALMWLDRKLKRGQRQREAQACAQAEQAMERWRGARQGDGSRGVADTNTQ